MVVNLPETCLLDFLYDRVLLEHSNCDFSLLRPEIPLGVIFFSKIMIFFEDRFSTENHDFRRKSWISGIIIDVVNFVETCLLGFLFDRVLLERSNYDFAVLLPAKPLHKTFSKIMIFFRRVFFLSRNHDFRFSKKSWFSKTVKIFEKNMS